MHFCDSYSQAPVLGWGNPFTTKGRRSIKRGVNNSASAVMDVKRKTENALNEYVIKPIDKYVYEPVVGNAISQVQQLPRRARNLSDALTNLDRSIPNLWNDVTTDPLSLLEAFPITDYYSDVTKDYYRLGKELAGKFWDWLINNLVNLLFGFIEMVINGVGTLNIFKYGSDILGKYLTMLNALIASATAGIGAVISQLASLSVSQVIDMIKDRVQKEVESYLTHVIARQVKPVQEGIDSYNQVKNFNMNDFIDRQVISSLRDAKTFIKNKLTGAKSTVESKLENMKVPEAKQVMGHAKKMLTLENVQKIVHNPVAKQETQILVKEANKAEARQILFEEQKKVIQASGIDPQVYDLMVTAGFRNKNQAVAYFNYRNKIIKNNNTAIALLGVVAVKQLA
jgi:hypothetical protein